VAGKRSTVESLLTYANKTLTRAGVPSPEVDAETLVAEGLGIRRSEVYLRAGSEVDPEKDAVILDLIERRAGRVPLQLLLGECEFMSLPFKVKEGVFIPRPETEVLVEAALKKTREGGGPVRRILDIGTGSGVVGISLAAHLKPEITVATDISLSAIETARVNAILNAVGGFTRFLVCDALGAIRVGSKTAFDLVVCNPPYVESGSIDGLQPEVRDYDPRAALDGGRDGLRFIDGLLPGVASILREGGVAALEIGATQGERVKGLFIQAGLAEVEVLKDLAGLDRVVIGRAM
jgi:release factor glutamine methyltransferase